jgi:thiol-disulfide isomerase/thioredoxin
MKRKIKLLTIFILNYFFFGFITWGNHEYMLPLILISTFVITYISIEKSQNIKKDIFLLNFPFVSLVVLTCLIGGDFSRGFLYILFVPCSTFLSYLYFRFKLSYIPIFSLTLFLAIGFIIYPNFYSFLKNNNSEKNLAFPKVSIIDNKNSKVNLYKNKIIVLDFWTTGCSICFKKFPDLESTYLKYRSNPNIQIYSINVPENRDKFQNTITILNNIGYKFPKIYAKSAKEIKDSLNIYSFPHLLILKNGRIRYNGQLETKENVFLYNIDDEIDKLLKE